MTNEDLINTSKSNTTFSSINIGNCFFYEGEYYIKTSANKIAMHLPDNTFKNFYDSKKVYPINAEIIVYN